jgi:hypothetical protein
MVLSSSSARLLTASGESLPYLASARSKLGQGALLGRLCPNAEQFGFNFLAHPPGNGVEHIALLMQETVLAWRGWE